MHHGRGAIQPQSGTLGAAVLQHMGTIWAKVLAHYGVSFLPEYSLLEMSAGNSTFFPKPKLWLCQQEYLQHASLAGSASAGASHDSKETLSEERLAGNPSWEAFKKSLERNGYFKVNLSALLKMSWVICWTKWCSFMGALVPLETSIFIEGLLPLPAIHKRGTSFVSTWYA